MPPKGKIKKIVIDKEANDVIDTHFAGQISLIKSSKLIDLFNEGLITNQTAKFLRKVKKLYSQSEKGDITLKITYELDEPKEEVKGDEVKGDEPINKPKESMEEGEIEEGEIEEGEVKEVEDEYSPDSPKYTQEGELILPDDPDRPGKYLDIKKSNYIIPHRKAFVDFVNQGFYKQVLRNNKSQDPHGPDNLTHNIYQTLVKEYLAIDTPYRGLLVYHGLGTGKTATAVSMAESVSSEMDIVTMLPASLENNFIGEVKTWGKNELDIHGSRWTFISYSDIEEKGTIRKELLKTYKVSSENIKEILNHTIREVKKKISLQLIEADYDIQYRKQDLLKLVNQEYKKVSKGVLVTKGFWKHDSKKGSSYDELKPYEKIFLECQIHRLIQLKYNFIHYNPLPTIKKSDQAIVKGSDGSDDSDEEDLFLDEVINKQSNESIKRSLLKDMKYNLKKYDVESPFYGKTIIIDEVHNFVREVLNDSGSARFFYEWIVNAENVKLVFLSGTPIINKPCEIAILYNMLKGRIKIFNFTVKSSREPSELTPQLNEIFYKKQSPIELFHISRKDGKLVVSFTMHTETFTSLMNPDNQVIYTSSEHSHEYKDFIEEIYKGLHKVFDIEDILPCKKDALSVDLDEYKVFDEIIKVPFLRKQTLFEIKHNNELIDLTSNEQFMDYFFTDSYQIEDKKKTLLRRMLMGMTSYYPIDRSKIGTMPTIQQPKINKDYASYIISQNITVEPCLMTSSQFSKYVEVWRSEKKKDLIRQMRRHLHDDMPFDFNIRTRQNCNIIYKDDEFRYIRDKDRAYIEKTKQYEQLRQLKLLEYNSQLAELSPKLHRILTNIQKFIKDKQSTGKILIYSDFRGDSGAEAIEETLTSNGYSKYNSKNPPSKSFKYTFITGQESPEERRLNMDAFNNPSNKYGEEIQIMVISGAGAEGISLTCVRQVHILEPYWNFVRIDQVFGRAIRLHSHDDLESKERTVEEYMYLSVLPKGDTIEELYQSIKDWSTVPELKDIKKELSLTKNKDVKDTLDMILNIGQTIDQKIFDIMERKYTVSKNIIDIIKESSLDCIQHTRDDPALNDKCIRFSNQLLHEISYFPGISANELFEIDQKHLKASFIKFIKPNHYVISGGDNEYIYYEVDEEQESVDVRYLRENAKKVCEVSLNDMNMYLYADKDHSLNSELGKQFSVYQDIYTLDPYYEKIVNEQLFPTIDAITKKNKHGYKIKYNINEMMFYSENKTDKLLRLYRFDEYMNQQISKALFIYEGDVFIED
tara:strand:- start:867 stop:4658 length:3792 start_codon:yes stop_codon:yes gene_type:complete